LQWVILIDVILSWFLPPQNGLRYFLGKALNPIYAPFRPISMYILRKWQIGLDFTPLFALLSLQILQFIIYNII
jgi:uncharacterized protein YggT (Ycf19 family)